MSKYLVDFPMSYLSDAYVSGDIEAGSPRVVVIGASIAGLLAAATLARESKRQVLLVTGPGPVTPLLRDGCSVRKSTVACFARGMGTTADDMWQKLGGEGAYFRGIGMQKISKGGKLSWLKLMAKMKDQIGLSTRHGHILRALRSSLKDPVRLVAASVDFDAADLSLVYEDGSRGKLALGKDDLVLNTLPRPLFGEKAPEAEQFVCVAQYPARLKPGASFPDEAIAPYFRDSAVHVGFITPFIDPDIPEATHYVLDSTLISAERNAKEGDAVLATIDRGAKMYAEAFGFELVDPARTGGLHRVPAVAKFDADPSRDGRVVNAYRAFHCGVPATNVDGMLAQARGSLAFAEALAKDENVPAALTASMKALKELRSWNKTNNTLLFKLPGWLGDMSVVMNKPMWKKLTEMWTNVASPTAA